MKRISTRSSLSICISALILVCAATVGFLSPPPCAYADNKQQVITTSPSQVNVQHVSGKWEKWKSGWYFKKSDGAYATGFIKPNSENCIYYLNGKGLMKTGWVKVKDLWYYANGNGSLYKGWLKWKGKWYYLDPKQAAYPAITGFFSDGKARYYCAPGSCAMKTGWIKNGEKWHWADSSGALQKGWKLLDTWYYLDPAEENYAAKVGYFKEDGKEYVTKSDCRLIMNNWAKVSSTEERYANTSGALMDVYADRSNGLRATNKAGQAYTGWQEFGSSWFYFKPEDGQAVTGWYKVNGRNYNFGKDYKWITISNNAQLDEYLYAIMKKNKNSFKKCYDDIAYNYSYRKGGAPSGKDWSVKFALEMAKKKSGNCYRYAALFAWVACGLGYDAKAVYGSVPAASGGWAPHGWVEIKYKGKTYICDPELQHVYTNVNFYWQTYASAPLEYRKSGS